MKKSKKIVTLTLLSALLAVPFMMDNVNAKEENSATTTVKEDKISVIYIPKMHCGGCEKSIVGLFNSIGVKATADHTTKKVVLDKKVTKKQLDDLLVAWPYQLTAVVKEEQANIDTIYVPSMHCGGCEKAIEKLFNSIGVKATADHTTKKVVLDKKLSLEQLDKLLLNPKLKKQWSYQLAPVVKEEQANIDTIYVPSMHCGGCEKAIEKLFNSIGVKATADHTTKKVVLDKKVSLEQLNNLLLNPKLKKQWPYQLTPVVKEEQANIDTIYIPSMMCKGCEKAIEKLFDSIGVKATADHTTKKVVLDKKLSLEQLNNLLLNPNLKKQWPYQLEAVEISKDEDKKEPQTDSTNGSLPKTSISSVSFITLVTSLTGAFLSKKRK